MKKIAQFLPIILSVGLLSLLILDGKTAAFAVTEGIQLCLNVIIPSLFPFFVITSFLNANLIGHSLPSIQYISRTLHLPNGCEMLFPLSLIGGYPVGAKLITNIYKSNLVDKRTAQILLGYCNNAGPAFIFGIAGTAFESPMIAFILWILHIISAGLTGVLLPKPAKTSAAIPIKQPSLSQILKDSISAITSICGWILIFKIFLSYLDQWFQSIMESPAGMVLTGLLELSNGCIAVSRISTPAVQFILYSVFFGFGGLCVLLQTVSVTESLGIGLYLHGKIIQAFISLDLAVFLGCVIFRDFQLPAFRIILLTLVSVIIIILTLQDAKKCGNSIHNHV